MGSNHSDEHQTVAARRRHAWVGARGGRLDDDSRERVTRPTPRLDLSQQYWVWVTTPEYYAEEDGSDRHDLDPTAQSDADGWWTCHRDTRQSDLVLVYRTTPKMDFGYLVQAESDAYSIADDDFAYSRGWDYGCDYRVLHKFQRPLTLSDVRSDPYLDEWGAFRANFQRRVYGVPEGVWLRLMARMEAADEDFSRFLSQGNVKKARAKVLLEKDLEDRLTADISLLRPFGFDLQVQARQLVCAGHGGRIDLLCNDLKGKRLVVIELKNVRAGQNTFGQISTYVGWVQQRLTSTEPAHGLVIARGFDTRFLAAASTSDRVSYVDLQDLGLE